MCQKCHGFAIHLILDKEEGKCDLNFDSTFDARKRRNQISYVFVMHLIPVKGEVKHVNNFDARQRRVKGASKARQRRVKGASKARQRRSKTPRLCIPLISYVKGVQRHHGFAQL